MSTRRFKAAWYLFFGRKLNMSRQEILVTTIGEMGDMVSCLSVYNGTAKEKKELSYEEIMR